MDEPNEPIEYIEEPKEFHDRAAWKLRLQNFRARLAGNEVDSFEIQVGPDVASATRMHPIELDIDKVILRHELEVWHGVYFVKRWDRRRARRQDLGFNPLTISMAEWAKYDLMCQNPKERTGPRSSAYYSPTPFDARTMFLELVQRVETECLPKVKPTGWRAFLSNKPRPIPKPPAVVKWSWIATDDVRDCEQVLTIVGRCVTVPPDG